MKQILLLILTSLLLFSCSSSKSIVGKWQGNYGVSVEIKSNGKIIVVSPNFNEYAGPNDPAEVRDTLEWKRLNDTTLELKSLDSYEATHYKLTLTDQTIDLRYQRNGNPFLFLIRKQESRPPIQEMMKTLQGEWDSGTNSTITYTIEGETMKQYREGVFYSTRYFQITDNDFVLHESDREGATGQYFSQYPVSFYFNSDTLILGNGNIYIKRTTPFERQPHFLEYNDSLPNMSIHTLLPPKVILEKFETISKEPLPYSHVGRDEAITFEAKYNSFLDSLINDPSVKQEFEDYQLVVHPSSVPSRYSDLCAVKNSPLVPAEKVIQMRVEKDFRRDSCAQVFLTFDSTALPEINSCYKEIRNVALKINGSIYRITYKSEWISNSRPAVYRMDQGTFMFEYSDKDLTDWRETYKKIHLIQ